MGKKRKHSGHSDKPARKIIRNKGSHDKTAKLPIAKTENFEIKQSQDTGEILVTIDERSLTSRFNTLKTGKFANLQTLKCNECDAKPAELGGTGQCKYYGKDLICYYDIKHAKMYDNLDTRKVSDIQTHVDIQVFQNAVLAQRAIALANMAGGIPDKVAHRQGAELREWLKFAQLLATPKITAKKTERFTSGDEFTEIIKELYVENPTTQEAQQQQADQGMTIGLKSAEEIRQDSMQEVANQKAEEDAIF